MYIMLVMDFFMQNSDCTLNHKWPVLKFNWDVGAKTVSKRLFTAINRPSSFEKMSKTDDWLRHPAWQSYSFFQTNRFPSDVLQPHFHVTCRFYWYFWALRVHQLSNHTWNCISPVKKAERKDRSISAAVNQNWMQFLTNIIHFIHNCSNKTVTQAIICITNEKWTAWTLPCFASSLTSQMRAIFDWVVWELGCWVPCCCTCCDTLDMPLKEEPGEPWAVVAVCCTSELTLRTCDCQHSRAKCPCDHICNTCSLLLFLSLWIYHQHCLFLSDHHSWIFPLSHSCPFAFLLTFFFHNPCLLTCFCHRSCLFPFLQSCQSPL